MYSTTKSDVIWAIARSSCWDMFLAKSLVNAWKKENLLNYFRESKAFYSWRLAALTGRWPREKGLPGLLSSDREGFRETKQWTEEADAALIQKKAPSCNQEGQMVLGRPSKRELRYAQNSSWQGPVWGRSN